MKKYVFKTVKTHRGTYLYERNTNTVIAINEKEFEDLQKVERKEIGEEACQTLKKYQELGILRENAVKEIKHPDTDYLKHYANCRIRQVILQVTQQCNLRCSYCVYSGNYDTRQHSDKRMSLETALKVIDYVICHSSEVDEVCFSFYGGEPLLEIELIRKCVAYVKEKMKGRKYSFSMTTNGTLLLPETVCFLVENNFRTSVSLDGPKEEHDINRRFRTGKGSFDTIMKNIQYIKENYYEFWENMSFFITLNPKVDMDKIVDFFETTDLVPHRLVQFNQISKTNLNNEELIQFGQKYHLSRRYRYLKVLMALSGMIEENQVDKMFIRTLSSKKMSIDSIKNGNMLSQCVHHGGPCVPGIRKLFVSVDGIFFPCEKVAENPQKCSVGNLESGLNIENMKRTLNLGDLTKEECMNCWAFQHCNICVAQMDVGKEEGLSREEKENVCRQNKMGFSDLLYEYCVLNECIEKRKERSL